MPLCLVLIGVSLAHYGIRGALRGATWLSIVKLVVQPLAVLLFARFGLGLGGVPLAIVVMMAALPVGSNALIFSQRYRTLPARSSTAIVVSTLAFVVSAPLWLAAFRRSADRRRQALARRVFRNTRAVANLGQGGLDGR